MPVSEQVIVELIARTDALEREMRRTGQSTDRQLSAIESRFRQFGGYLTGVLGGISAAALVSEFLSLADASKSLDAQLRLATAGFGTFAQAQTDVRRVSADARADLEDTASLYGSFARTSKELGKSQQEAAQATETFTKALKIGGAGTQEVQSATLQMGQALASTNVQWEELGQILEASPRLARVFTDSLGITRQQLKQMASDGKLSGEMLFDALNNREITRGINAEFEELPVTFDEAMTQVHNAAIITFGAFDRGGQFSTALANFVTGGSDGFKDLERDALEMGIAIRSNIEGLAGAFQPLFDDAKRFFDFVNGQSVKVDIGRDIDKSMGQIDAFTAWATDDPISRALGWSGTNLQDRYRKYQSQGDLRLRRENGLTGVSRTLGKLSEANKAASAPRSAAAAASGPTDADKRKAVAAQRKAEAEARKAENERLRAIRDDASKQRDAANLQDDINAAKAALSVATDDVLKFNLQQIDSEKAQRIAEYETQHDLGRLSAQELADRTAAVNQLADLQKQRVQQIARENQRRDALDVAQASNRNDQDLLRAQLDLTDARTARKEVELRLLDLTYQQERNELEAVIASETASKAQKDIATARLALLAQLKNYDVQSTNRQYESPLEQRRRQVRETAANMSDAVENIELNAVDKLTDGLEDAATEFLHLGGIAGDVLNSIISDFVRLAAQQAIFGSLGGGSGGSLLGGLGKLFGIAGARATGGPVNGGQTYLVGENGPELFRASSSGTIVPNHQLNATAAASMTGVRAAVSNSTGTVAQALHFDLRGAVVTEDLLTQMNQMAEQAAIQGAQGGRALAARDLKATLRPRM